MTGDGAPERAARLLAVAGDDDLEGRVRARLRALRHERMLTLAQAAQRAGMDPSAWSRLESGARRLTFAHRPCVHAGHQWLHVLSGRLRLTLGDERQVLAPGEAAQFSTWTPHSSTVVDEPVELLVTFDPEGSRHG